MATRVAICFLLLPNTNASPDATTNGQTYTRRAVIRKYHMQTTAKHRITVPNAAFKVKIFST